MDGQRAGFGRGTSDRRHGQGDDDPGAGRCRGTLGLRPGASANGATTPAAPTARGSSPRRRSPRPTCSQLQVAWTYPAGQTDFNPLVVRGVVYGRGANGSFVALDAATGKEIWIHKGVQGFNGRGVNYWESKDGKDRRLIFSANNILQEIDAQTGRDHSVVRRGRPGRSARRARPRSRDGQPAEPHCRDGSSRT